MLYASLKAVHLLAIIVWVGGMFFMLHCLRPAASLLEPPLRLALLHATMRRFFAVVIACIGAILLSGAAMIAMAWSASRRRRRWQTPARSPAAATSVPAAP